jgi:hypothetical protein
MTSKVKPEVRRVGPTQSPRWVIIDDGTKVPTQRRFWNGTGWVEGLRNAALYAHKHLILKELERAKSD